MPPLRFKVCLSSPSLMNVDPCLVFILDRKGLGQLLERLTAEREVVDSIPGTGQILTVLKLLVNEGTAFALQMAGSSSGSVTNHVKWGPRLQKET